MSAIILHENGDKIGEFKWNIINNLLEITNANNSNTDYFLPDNKYQIKIIRKTEFNELSLTYRLANIDGEFSKTCIMRQ